MSRESTAIGADEAPAVHLSAFAVEELEVRLEMGTCYHFPCIHRDWKGDCDLHGPADFVLTNVSKPLCDVYGSDATYIP